MKKTVFITDVSLDSLDDSWTYSAMKNEEYDKYAVGYIEYMNDDILISAHDGTSLIKLTAIKKDKDTNDFAGSWYKISYCSHKFGLKYLKIELNILSMLDYLDKSSTTYTDIWYAGYDIVKA